MGRGLYSRQRVNVVGDLRAIVVELMIAPVKSPSKSATNVRDAEFVKYLRAIP